MRGFEWNRLDVENRKALLVEMGHGKNPKIDQMASSEFKELPDVVQRTLGFELRAQMRAEPKII